jgi:putative endonuclease
VTSGWGAARKDHRRALGASGEELAARHLEALGFESVDRNFRTRHGELDLVARDQQRVLFCEVKTRIVTATTGPLASPRPYGPLDSIGVRKRRQIRAMARIWLTEAHDRLGSGSPAEIRFDAVGITLDDTGRLIELEHLEGAF